jgi:hypothetical protein
METIIYHKTIAIMLAKEMKPLGNEVLSPNGEQINVFVDVETHYLDFKIHMKKTTKVNGLIGKITKKNWLLPRKRSQSMIIA